MTIDLGVARAKRAMSDAPHERWTVASLARLAGASRAAFARKFKRETKRSPMAWLRDLRLARAEDALRDPTTTLAAIAATVGYADGFALSRAFKRWVGIAPATFRRAQHGTTIRAAA